MYQYKFVKINLTSIAEKTPREDYKKIIEEHAMEGWRLVQIFSPPVSNAGSASYFELIFEKYDEN